MQAIVQIRNAEVSDASSINELVADGRAAYPNFVPGLDETWIERMRQSVTGDGSIEETREHIRTARDCPEAALYLSAMIGDVLVGTLYAYTRPVAGARESSIIDRLFVHGDYRGQGIGRGLLDHCFERWAPPDNPTYLYVVAGNPAARLYQRYGFTKVEHQQIHGMPTDIMVYDWGKENTV